MNNSDKPSASDFPLTKNQPKDQAEIWVNESLVPTKRKTQARPRTFWTYFKWTVATVFCLFAMTAGAILGNWSHRSSTLGGIIKEVFEHPTDPLAAFQLENNFSVTQQPVIHVLLLGCDRDYKGFVDKYGNVYGVPIPGSRGRSDSIMIARLDLKHNTINLLSIPRDTAVRIPDPRSLNGYAKINAAWAWGGQDLAISTIQQTFGINIDYCVALDFDGFQKIVDSIGGVDVVIHKPLNYEDHYARLIVHLKPDPQNRPQHLNGYKAMGYVRVRHDDNDLMRAERQHEFLEDMRNQITRPGTILKIPDLVNAITESIHSNLTTDQMLSLANWARNVPKQNIQVATLPSFEGRSFVFVNKKPSEDLIRNMFFDGVGDVTIHAPERGFENTSRITWRKRHHSVRQVVPATDMTTDPAANQDVTPVDDSPMPVNDNTGSTDTGSKTDKPDKTDNSDTGKKDGGSGGGATDKGSGDGKGSEGKDGGTGNAAGNSLGNAV